LILAIVARVRDRDEQTRAVVSADIRALQMRMNPHFLLNALNALAALAKVAPREVPRATGRLRQFLQASFCQPERTLVPLEEELAVVDAYLDIESLRFGGRLEVEQTIGPGLLKVLVPPFSFQPLVENAIEHGLRSLPGAGRLRLVIRATGPWLEMNVTDDGQGVPFDGSRTAFLRRTPAASRAGTVTPALAGTVRALISVGGAKRDWRGHNDHYGHSATNSIRSYGEVARNPGPCITLIGGLIDKFVLCQPPPSSRSSIIASLQ
jgi:Histidine kinase